MDDDLAQSTLYDRPIDDELTEINVRVADGGGSLLVPDGSSSAPMTATGASLYHYSNADHGHYKYHGVDSIVKHENEANAYTYSNYGVLGDEDGDDVLSSESEYEDQEELDKAAQAKATAGDGDDGDGARYNKGSEVERLPSSMARPQRQLKHPLERVVRKVTVRDVPRESVMSSFQPPEDWFRRGEEIPDDRFSPPKPMYEDRMRLSLVHVDEFDAFTLARLGVDAEPFSAPAPLKRRVQEEEEEAEDEPSSQQQPRTSVPDTPATWTSISNGKKAPVSNRNWNDEYQKLVEMPIRHAFDRVKAITDMTRLLADFAYFSERIAERIVRELPLPAEEKTVPPLSAQKGIAGGTKYVWCGIFFKFATDVHSLYGSDYFAAKAAKNEMRHMNAVIDASIRQLHTTLSILFMVNGQAVIATAIAPISPATLQLGSDDAGRTVHDESPELRALMAEVADNLHLKPHLVVPMHGAAPEDRGVVMHLAGDTEGHAGVDGRFYLLDLARLIPPLPPSKQHPMGHLYQVFRPEFMQSYHKPLSSDAFTGWGRHKAEEHNREVLDALQHLRTVVIPAFVVKLDSLHAEAATVFLGPVQLTSELFVEDVHGDAPDGDYEDGADDAAAVSGNGDAIQPSSSSAGLYAPPQPGQTLPSTTPVAKPPPLMQLGSSERVPKPSTAAHSEAKVRYQVNHLAHEAGVNIRDIGLVYRAATTLTVRQALLVEMVTRVAKIRYQKCARRLLHSALLRSLQSHRLPLMHMRLAKLMLMLTCGEGPESAFFWTNVICADVRLKFNVSVKPADLEEVRAMVAACSYDRDVCYSDAQAEFFSRAAKRMGVDIRTNRVFAAMRGVLDKRFPDMNPDEIRAYNDAYIVRVPPFELLEGEKTEQRLLDELKLRQGALGEMHVGLLSSIVALVDVYKMAQHQADEVQSTAFTNAEAYMTRALRVREAYDESLQAKDAIDQYPHFALHTLYGRAADMYLHFAKLDQALKMAKKAHASATTKLPGGATSRGALAALVQVARVHLLRGESEDAELALKRVLFVHARSEQVSAGEELPALDKPEDVDWTQFGPEVAATLNHLAVVYKQQGRLEAAAQLYRSALSLCLHYFGAGHPHVAALSHNLAVVFEFLGEGDKAERLYARAIAITKDAFGPQHPETGRSMFNLARLLFNTTLTRYKERAAARQAEKEKAAAAPIRAPPKKNTKRVRSKKKPTKKKPTKKKPSLGPLALLARGKSEEEVEEDHMMHMLEDARMGGVAAGAGNAAAAERAEPQRELQVYLPEEQRKALALSYFAEVEEIYSTSLGPAHPDTASVYSAMALVHVSNHAWEQALPLAERAAAIFRGLYPDIPDHHERQRADALVAKIHEQRQALPIGPPALNRPLSEMEVEPADRLEFERVADSGPGRAASKPAAAPARSKKSSISAFEMNQTEFGEVDLWVADEEIEIDEEEEKSVWQKMFGCCSCGGGSERDGAVTAKTAGRFGGGDDEALMHEGAMTKTMHYSKKYSKAYY